MEKATGGWRPVIDLSPLNLAVKQTKFKMETVASVMASIREGDFMASLDLKDAYFQIPIHPRSRRYLRFVSEGVVYQFKLCASDCPLLLRCSLVSLPLFRHGPTPWGFAYVGIWTTG